MVHSFIRPGSIPAIAFAVLTWLPHGQAQETATEPQATWKQTEAILPFLPISQAELEASGTTNDGPLPGVAEAVVMESVDDSAGAAVIDSTVEDEEAEPIEMAGVETVAGASPEEAGQLILGGWLAQGMTWNPDSPRNRFNTPVLFNDRANEFQLNQLYLYLDAPVAANGDMWELGGRLDLLFGTDFRFVTVPGLEEHRDSSRRINSESRRFYGVAFPQLYAELGVPVLEGASIKVGHFYSIFGHDRVEAPENFFYSRSYAYAYGQPFTHTGVLTRLNVSDSVALYNGVTTGWDNWRHPGNEIGYLGGLSWQSHDGWTAARATFHIGNDLTGVNLGSQPVDERRYTYSLVFLQRLHECLTWVIQQDYGLQEDGSIFVDNSNATIRFDDAQWYGVSTQLIWQMSDNLASGFRFEWFNDDDLSRTLAPVTFVPGGRIVNGSDYFAATFGINWNPWTHVTVRPEVRWDWSNLRGNAAAPGASADFRAFDDRTDGSQLTIGMDVIVRF